MGDRSEAVSTSGSWVRFWDQALFATMDEIDANTADVEGLHSAQQKLLGQHAGGGNDFDTFTAKCMNRSGSTEFETSCDRNKSKLGRNELACSRGGGVAEGGLVAHLDTKTSRRGGVQSGKQVLGFEVVREFKCKANDPRAHAETRARWEAMSDAKRQLHNSRARLERQCRQGKRKATATDASAPEVGPSAHGP